MDGLSCLSLQFPECISGIGDEPSLWGKLPWEARGVRRPEHTAVPQSGSGSPTPTREREAGAFPHQSLRRPVVGAGQDAALAREGGGYLLPVVQCSVALTETRAQGTREGGAS